MEIVLAMLAEMRAEQSAMRAELAGIRSEVATLRGRAAVWGALAGSGLAIAVALVLRGLGI